MSGGTEFYIIELVDNLGTFSLVDMSKQVGHMLTFSFVLNKNVQNCLSSVTYFVWLNRDIDEVTFLRDRFRGNFRLRSSRSLEISSIFDALHALGFEELRDFSEIDNLDFFSTYPIFRSLEIQTSRGAEIIEVVEELRLSEGFVYQPHCQSILIAERNHYTDTMENDILTKTLFSESYHPDMGLKYYNNKVFIILENFYLENMYSIPPSILSFCDQEPCFVDPYRCLKPAFSKSFWSKRYHGEQPIFEYLSERRTQGKFCYNHLPSFALMEWWLKGMDSPFDYYHG